MTNPFNFNPSDVLESEPDLDFNQFISEFGQLPTNSIKEVEFETHSPVLDQGEIGFVVEAVRLEDAVRTMFLSYPDRKVDGRVIKCVLSPHVIAMSCCDGGFFIQIAVDLPIPMRGLTAPDQCEFVLELRDLLALLFASDTIISFKLNASRTRVNAVSGPFERPLALVEPSEFKTYNLLNNYTDDLPGLAFSPPSFLYALQNIAPSVDEESISVNLASISIKSGLAVGGTTKCIVLCTSAGLNGLLFQVRPYWCEALTEALKGVETATFVHLPNAIAIRTPRILVVLEAISGSFPEQPQLPTDSEANAHQIRMATTSFQSALRTFNRLFPPGTVIELQYAPRKRTVAGRPFSDVCRLRAGRAGTARVTVEIGATADILNRKSFRFQLGAISAATSWLRGTNAFLDFNSDCLVIDEPGPSASGRAIITLEDRPGKPVAKDQSVNEAKVEHIS